MCPLAASTITEAPGLPAPTTHRRERASTALSLQVGFVTTFLLIVVVLPEGFEYDGKNYGSLTAVAKAITGEVTLELRRGVVAYSSLASE